MTAARKLRKCQACNGEYEPRNTLQKVCSTYCALSLVQRAKEKQERKELAIRKRQLKSRADWLKAAQAAFNAWVRARDSERACISCGRFHNGQWHAGHYRSVAAAPALRFCELNVHRQCSPCNTHLSGNLIEYRINLATRIGQENLEWIEGPHGLVKYTIEQLTAIRDLYRGKLKEWEKERL